MKRKTWKRNFRHDEIVRKVLMIGITGWMLWIGVIWVFNAFYQTSNRVSDDDAVHCGYWGDGAAPDFTLCTQQDQLYLFPQKNQFRAAEISPKRTSALHLSKQEWASLYTLAETLGRTITSKGFWYNESDKSVHIYGVPILLPFLLLLLGAIWRIHRLKTEYLRLSRFMHQAREQERLHLARELHDGPLQELQRLALQLREDNVVQGQQLISPIAGSLRAICADLRPPALTHLGLDVAIESFVHQVEERHAIEVHTALVHENLQLSEYVRLVVFRIMQEAIQNALKHAHPHHIWVRLQITENVVRLEVQNDGQGFNVPKDFVGLAELGHYGLLGMQERISTLNGRLTIESNHESGTTVTAMCPVA